MCSILTSRLRIYYLNDYVKLLASNREFFKNTKKSRMFLRIGFVGLLWWPRSAIVKFKNKN